MIKGIFVFVLIIVLAGCRKVPVESPEFSSVDTTQSTTVAVYNAIDKVGVLHADTMIYTDEAMTIGFPVKAGESVILVGESNNNYIVFYGDKKGYISKNYVLIVDGVDSSDGTGDSKVVSVSENVVVNEQVETVIITETQKAPSFIKEESTTTAAPPTSLYTTKQATQSGYASELSSQLNTARKTNGLNSLSSDSGLKKEAEYYCDIFAQKNSISNISGYKVQAAGKIKGAGELDKLSKTLANNIVGLNDDSVSKVGISVIEGDRGYLFYVVLAK